MNEKLIEKKLREMVKRRGGLALKWASPFYTGMPDRLVLLPGGMTYFVELKTTSKNPSAVQIQAMKKLTALGFQAFVIDSQEGLDTFQKLINDGI
jgi:VRR-NUC domain.